MCSFVGHRFVRGAAYRPYFLPKRVFFVDRPFRQDVERVGFLPVTRTEDGHPFYFFYPIGRF